MKRTRMAAAMTAVAALAVPVVAAAPAHASEVVHVRVDPRDWTWSGTITLNACGNPIKSQSFTVNPNSGLHDILEFEVGLTDDCESWIETEMNTFAGGNATYTGVHLERRVKCSSVWTCPELSGTNYYDETGVDITYMFGDLDDGWELKLFPSVFASGTQSNTVTATANVNTTEPRSTNAGHVTLNPNRVTAMAKRLVASPGDLINIHGYGQDRDLALSRADHVRDHLLAEITRLGGDPDAYPVMVVYGGDPDHKNGVHVTIHQHAGT